MSVLCTTYYIICIFLFKAKQLHINDNNSYAFQICDKQCIECICSWLNLVKFFVCYIWFCEIFVGVALRPSQTCWCSLQYSTGWGPLIYSLAYLNSGGVRNPSSSGRWSDGGVMAVVVVVVSSMTMVSAATTVVTFSMDSVSCVPAVVTVLVVTGSGSIMSAFTSPEEYKDILRTCNASCFHLSRQGKASWFHYHNILTRKGNIYILFHIIFQMKEAIPSKI